MLEGEHHSVCKHHADHHWQMTTLKNTFTPHFACTHYYTEKPTPDGSDTWEQHQGILLLDVSSSKVTHVYIRTLHDSHCRYRSAVCRVIPFTIRNKRRLRHWFKSELYCNNRG